MLSIANFAAPEAGARVTAGSEDSTAPEALAEVADLLAANKLVVKVRPDTPHGTCAPGPPAPRPHDRQLGAESD